MNDRSGWSRKLAIFTDGVFLRSLVVGGVIYLAYLVWVYIGVEWIHWDQDLVVSLGYFAGVLLHFAGNKLLAFRDGAIRTAPIQLTKHALLVGLNYGITLGVTRLSSLWLGTVMPGAVVSIPATTLFSYLVMRWFIFSPPKSS